MKPDNLEMVADGRFAVWEDSDGGIGAKAAGRLLEAQKRILSEYSWHELAAVTGLIHRLHKGPQGTERPPIIESLREILSARLYNAVLACADELPEAMRKAAAYVSNPTAPPGKMGGVKYLEQRAGLVLPPVPIAYTVIEAALSAVRSRWMSRRREPGLSLVPYKAEVRAAWENQKWFEAADAESARLPGSTTSPFKISERKWVELWKEVGLDDLERKPKPKAKAVRKRR